MLRMLGGTSVNTLPLTPFERSCPASVASRAIVWHSCACCDTCVWLRCEW